MGMEFNGGFGINDKIQQALERIRTRIIERINQTRQRASGKTQDSLQVEMYIGGGRLLGRRAFETLETGRKGGKVPMTFTAIIKQWIKDKGLSWQAIAYKRQESDKWKPKYTPEERGLQAMAGAIAHKIKQEGTKLYRDGGRNDVYSPIIREEIEKLKKEIQLEIIKLIKLN